MTGSDVGLYTIIQTSLLGYFVCRPKKMAGLGNLCYLLRWTIDNLWN